MWGYRRIADDVRSQFSLFVDAVLTGPACSPAEAAKLRTARDDSLATAAMKLARPAPLEWTQSPRVISIGTYPSDLTLSEPRADTSSGGGFFATYLPDRSGIDEATYTFRTDRTDERDTR
ncbi:MAG: hypothetical protein S0880_09950 [Actinomycetota bacterium]|nr:hypothetical protein [Actinomycetota bacterium]